MTIKQTADGKAAVDHDHYWIPVAEQKPPTGPKLLLIDRKLGVAVIGAYRKGDTFTHWQGLPKFKERK